MIYPWSHWSGIIFIMVYSSLLLSWGSLSVCVCEISKHQNFISHCLLWQFLRQCHQCKVESFLEYRTKPIDGRSLSFSTELSTHTTVFLLFFTATRVTLKALPACPSVCCLSLFGFLFEPLLPFHDLCPKVSHSSKLSSKCIHAHKHKTHSQMPAPKTLRKEWEWWENYFCNKLQLFSFSRSLMKL